MSLQQAVSDLNAAVAALQARYGAPVVVPPPVVVSPPPVSPPPSSGVFDPATLDATTTGPRIATATYSDAWDYTAGAGAKLNGLHIRGKLICVGDGVQATDCQIDGGVTTYYAGNYSSGHKFTHCGIGVDGGKGGQFPALGDYAVLYGDYEIGWCDVRGFSDLVWLQGSDTWLHHSWLHQNLLASAADHNDICQMTSGSNVLAEYNRLSCDLDTQNSAFQLGADTGPISNVEIRFNLFDSTKGVARNQHMIVWGKGSGGGAAGLNVHDNTIDTSVWTGGMVSNGNGDPYTWHNNRDRAGRLVSSGGQT